jgi:adenosylcobinamide-GDP ribazoletransferase
MALRSIAGGLRGGVAFLTRVPIGTTERDWDRFRSFPAALPLVAYPIGAIAALPLLVPGLPGPIAAFGYVVALLALVGIPHLDGVADVGDAMAAHGPDAARRALKDTETGVGAIVAVGVVIGGLGLGGIALAGLPARVAISVVIAAEVGAKLGMATIACLGTAAHEGLGSAFTERADAGLLVGPILASLPAVLLAAPAGAIAVAVGPLVALALRRWARDAIGGVNGDVFGATNELGRVLALQAGVIAWTVS